MRQANLYAAKAQLSELVQAALDGEEVWIARAGKPLVRLVPGSPAHRLSGRGSLDLEAGCIDAAFAPEVEGAVAALLGGESEGWL
ncbi:type II toxin-antitoxin system prevent-host-death family antitoxin [Synechococcus sp. CS-1325]|uniref:type II toxin-antitoxin system Phd/YefM family antitoxin n=1 Tax=Synechococcus sp. CS-1325 TaxID=2847979 RepID=UPI000DB0A4C4|nr:type II toxin-antitoxin system prevent-host-death family antitoxin [Synechococcus sp. CS-1325]MCT0198273.1 type II toxin-antitoxin system prevent-host-death family antitoxin [Synechococcus sp. CS-1325]PZV00702.1 MAG: type II toxin-antitoxin system prevent-host-death family antitoxin [Cyanobium sp.]